LDSKELTNLGKTDATAPLVVGNTVYDPLTFAPKIVKFSRKQYLFLNTYKLGTPLEEAARKAELSVEQAERFLDKPDVRAWLEDRALMNHIKTEWEEPAKWWSMGNEVLEGKKEMSKIQFGVWENFGDRVAPKKSFNADNSPKVVININPEAVREAVRRQDAIDGEVVQ
jgi:hypothetical protein